LSGHYTTYAQIEGDNSIEESERKRRWAHFSDETVREAEEKEVLGCEAYLLFYHRVDGLAIVSADCPSPKMKMS
jgi:ubiquitin C-terminal hydrolase